MPVFLHTILFSVLASVNWVQEASDSRTPLWVPIVLLVIIILLFWWGLTRPSLKETAGDEHEEAYGDTHTSPVPQHEAHSAHEAKTAVAGGTEGVASVSSEPEAVTAPKVEVSPEPDDLKRIEGIGPKIEQILHEAGIKTYAQLAATSVSELERIVRQEAGIRVAYPDTWPEQAKLAAAGDWTGLEKLQDELKGGRRQ